MTFSLEGATVKSKSTEELVLVIAGSEQKLSGIAGVLFKVHDLQLSERVWADGKDPLLLNSTSASIVGAGECDSGTLHVLTHPRASSKQVRVQFSPLLDEYKKRMVVSWAAGIEKDMICPARLHFFEADWEAGRDASWHMSVYVEPHIYSKLEAQVQRDRIRSMQLDCKFRNLYRTIHYIGLDDFVLPADASDWTTKIAQGECEGYEPTLERMVFASDDQDAGTTPSTTQTAAWQKAGLTDDQVKALVTAIRKAGVWIGGCVMFGALMVALAVK